jgi:hypothetical protein
MTTVVEPLVETVTEVIVGPGAAEEPPPPHAKFTMHAASPKKQGIAPVRNAFIAAPSRNCFEEPNLGEDVF